MKLKLIAPRARNPFVALARVRHAGSHRPDRRAARRQSAMALQRELKEMKPPWT